MRTTVDFDGTTISLNLPRRRVLVEHCASAEPGKVVIITDKVYVRYTGTKGAPLHISRGNIFTPLWMRLPATGQRTFNRSPKQHRQQPQNYDVRIIVPPHVTTIFGERINGALDARYTD
jgi:hypothetical protein